MSSISSSGKSFKLALIQLAVGANKSANLSRAAEKVEEAAKKGAQVRKESDDGLVRFCSSGRELQTFIYKISLKQIVFLT